MEKISNKEDNSVDEMAAPKEVAVTSDSATTGNTNQPVLVAHLP